MSGQSYKNPKYDPLFNPFLTRSRKREELKDLAAADEDPKCISIEHPKFKFQCKSCKRMYKTEHGFKSHLPCIGDINMMGEKTMSCSHCGNSKLFEEEKDLKLHLKSVHGPKGRDPKP